MPCFVCSANRIVKSDTVAEKYEMDATIARIVSRPVRYPAQSVLDMSARSFAQLFLVDSGVMQMTVPSGHWTVQPPHAIWIPAFTFHQMKAESELKLYTVAVPRRFCCDHFATESRLMGVSSLLRELTHRLAEAPENYDEGGYYERVAELIPDELDWSPVHSIRLPRLRDSRLVCIQEALLSNLSDRRTLRQWADVTNTSCRTMARLFQKEANACFCDWRNQLRLSIAIPMLTRGESVTSVAFSVGFESAGTFTTMFRQFMGVSPSQYAIRSRDNTSE